MPEVRVVVPRQSRRDHRAESGGSTDSCRARTASTHSCRARTASADRSTQGNDARHGARGSCRYEASPTSGRHAGRSLGVREEGRQTGRSRSGRHVQFCSKATTPCGVLAPGTTTSGGERTIPFDPRRRGQRRVCDGSRAHSTPRDGTSRRRPIAR
jgi:hypothetical protein